MTDTGSQTCEHTEEEKRLADNMQSQSSKSTKERLADLKSHIMNVEQLTKQYEQEGLVIPNAEKFINSCEEIKKKIDMHYGEEKKINHLKNHVAELEDLTAEVNKDNLESKSFDDFLKSCIEFKQTLDDRKIENENKLDEGDLTMINKINTAIELSMEAKQEGLISCSIDNFIKSCEQFKHLIKDHKKEKAPTLQPRSSSMNIMKNLRCNINNMMDLMIKSKSKGAIKTNVDEFLKTCESFKSKLNAKLAHAGSQSDPCQCDVCKSDNIEGKKSFNSACRMPGGEIFAPSKDKNDETCPTHSVKSRNSCSCIECNCAVDAKASKSFHSLARIPEEDVFGNAKQKKGHTCKFEKPDSSINSTSHYAVDTKGKTTESSQSQSRMTEVNKTFRSVSQVSVGAVFSPKATVHAGKNETHKLKAICCEPDKKVTSVESFHSVRRMSGGEVFAPQKDTNNKTCCVPSDKTNDISDKKVGESKSFHSYGRVTEDAISIRSKHSNACGCVKCSCQTDKPIEASKSTDSGSLLSKGEVVRKVISSLISDSIRNLASVVTSDKKCETCSVSEDKTMSGGEIYQHVIKKEITPKNSSKKSFILRRFKSSGTDNSPSSSFVPRKSSKTVAIYNKCLGLIEKQVRKITKISRVRNPDGTINEVKEIITIKQKKHNLD